ncbi:MAG: hypothetical protein K1X49_04580 [Saprospiraceae bacterium]|jgi:hypothetical protein|nr:hypothetical protein [Saprospiraceae bacterium]
MMNRKSKFIIVLVSAAITIGVLALTVGKPHYARHKYWTEHCHQSESQQSEQK